MNRASACMNENGLVLKWCYRCGHYRPSVFGKDGWICCHCGYRIRDWVSELLYGQN